MKKTKRGEWHSALEKEDGISVIKWMDNSIVSVASTANGVSPVSKVKRYSQKEKKIILVPQPQAIKQYNAHMGGTDRMDEDINAYRVGIRGKKWWWPLFTWLLDACINNSWLMYKKSIGPITKLEFRRQIAQVYLTRYKCPVKCPGGVASKASTSKGEAKDIIRFDKVEHYVAEVPNSKRRRCAGENCKSSGRTMCEKCDVGLCIKCFSRYHKK